MDKISKHISYKEAIRSTTAKRYNIDNTPNDFQLANMKLVAENCFEPARNHFDHPLFVSSFSRSLLLNNHRKIRGSKSSQHMSGVYTKLEESAIDIDNDVYSTGPTNSEIFHWLKDNVEFDQLIWEYGNDDEPAWVHVSYRKGANRGQVLIAYRNSKGKTKYKLFK